MHITKRAHLYQLAFMPTIFPVNCYLFEETDGLTLIDTGLTYSFKTIIKTSKRIGKPIKRIVLTHPHSDHIGSLDKLKQMMPKTIVYASKRDLPLMLGDFSLREDEKDIPIKGGFVSGLKTYPDILLENNDAIGSLKVISTPGHTPGSIAFYDKQSKILIAGDALQVRGGIAVAGDKRALFPFPALATWDKVQSIESVQKLLDLSISVLAVGHGKMIDNPVPLLEEAIRMAQLRLQKEV